MKSGDLARLMAALPLFLWTLAAPFRLLMLQVDYYASTNTMNANWMDTTAVAVPGNCPAGSSLSAFTVQLHSAPVTGDTVQLPSIVLDVSPGASGRQQYSLRMPRKEDGCSESNLVDVGGLLWREIGGGHCDRIKICVNDFMERDYVRHVFLADIREAGARGGELRLSMVNLMRNFRRLSLSDVQEYANYINRSDLRDEYIAKMGGFANMSAWYSFPMPQYRLGGQWMHSADGKVIPPDSQLEEDGISSRASYMESLVAHMLPFDILSFRQTIEAYHWVTYFEPDSQGCFITGLDKSGQMCLHEGMQVILADIIEDGLASIGCEKDLISRDDVIAMAVGFTKQKSLSVLEPYFSSILRCSTVKDAVQADLRDSRILAWYIQQTGQLTYYRPSTIRMGNLIDGEVTLSLQAKVGPMVTLGESSATIWTSSVEGFFNQQQWCTRTGPTLWKEINEFKRLSFPRDLEIKSETGMTLRDCLRRRYLMMPYMHSWAAIPYGGNLNQIPNPSPRNVNNVTVILEVRQAYRRTAVIGQQLNSSTSLVSPSSPSEPQMYRLDLLTALHETFMTRIVPKNSVWKVLNGTRINDVLAGLERQGRVAKTNSVLAYCGKSGGCTKVGASFAPDNESVPFVDGYELGVKKLGLGKFNISEQHLFAFPAGSNPRTSTERSVPILPNSAPPTAATIVNEVPVPICNGVLLTLLDPQGKSAFLDIGVGDYPCQTGPPVIRERWGLNTLGTGANTMQLCSSYTNNVARLAVIAPDQWNVVPNMNLPTLGFNSSDDRKWSINLWSHYSVFSSNVFTRLIAQPHMASAGSGSAVPVNLQFGILGTGQSSYGRLNTLSNFAAMISILVQIIDFYSMLDITRTALLLGGIVVQATGASMKLEHAAVFLELPLQYLVCKGLGHLFLSNLASVMVVANMIRPEVRLTLSQQWTELFLITGWETLNRGLKLNVVLCLGQIISSVWVACVDEKSSVTTQTVLWLSITLDLVLVTIAGTSAVVYLQGGFVEYYIDNAALIAILIVISVFTMNSTKRQETRQQERKKVDCDVIAACRVIGDSSPELWRCSATTLRPAAVVVTGATTPGQLTKVVANDSNSSKTADTASQLKKKKKHSLVMRWDETAAMLAIAEYRGRALGTRYVLISSAYGIRSIDYTAWWAMRCEEGSHSYSIRSLSLVIPAEPGSRNGSILIQSAPPTAVVEGSEEVQHH